jgi:hypothetical protein
MPVERDLEAEALGQESHLTAEKAHGVHIRVVIACHPGEARTKAEALGGGGRSPG